MTDTTDPTPPEEAPETVDRSPEYDALPKKDREEIDLLLGKVQEVQNEVDKWCGVMGGPVFFLAGLVLRQELQLRTARRECRELLTRVRALEDAIS